MVAATVPGGTSSTASRQSVLDASDGSARKGATSATYRSARPLRCANREWAPDRAAYVGLSRRASSGVGVDLGMVSWEGRGARVDADGNTGSTVCVPRFEWTSARRYGANALSECEI